MLSKYFPQREGKIQNDRRYLEFFLLYIFLIQNIKEWEFQNFFFTCLPDFYTVLLYEIPR